MSVADPAEPLRVQDLGIPPSLVLDIAVRRILREGQTTTMRLAERLRISPVLADQVIEKLRHDRMIEIQGAEGRSYILQLSEPGRQFAVERMDSSKYTGAVPVSLEDYTRVVAAQHQRPTITPDSIRDAFSDLVISDELLGQLGPAIHTPGSIFLYGPPGTGKTSIAERMINTEHDTVLIPHAVEVDSQIVTVYDPMVHVAIDPQPERLDRRWMRCERPSVIVGGELQARQLDLSYQADAGVYLAPLQMIANNGVLTIDDFGRQSLTPEQLLNRWIVPLDRDVDFLSLDYGAKFEVPFLTKIVFATNLDPSKLADEAFYRRIGSKILIPPITDDAFDEVLRRVGESRQVTIQPEAPSILRKGSRVMGDGDLRPYLPGAIATLVTSIAAYEGTTPVMNRDTLERALVMFFSTEDDMHGTSEQAPVAPGPSDPPDVDHPTRTDRVDPGESARLFEAVLAATEELLWVDSAEAARKVSVDLIADLGLTEAPQDASVVEVIDVDLSFSSGERLRVLRPRDHAFAGLAERQFHRYAAAGARSLELSAGQHLLERELSIDPTTGLVTGDVATKLIGRLGVDDVVVTIAFDTDPSEGSADERNAAFARVLREQVRSRDRCGYLDDGRFVVVILGGVEQDPVTVLDRVFDAWSGDGHDDAGGFSAGYARAGELPNLALVAARNALHRAQESGGGNWVAATESDYE
jgi:predicted ATPase with chaperone activity